VSDSRRAIADFLNQKRVAIVGVSRNEGQTANFIYRTLRDAGWEVKAVNPSASELEGDRCYPDLASIPGGVDAALIVTRPEVTNVVVRECAKAGIRKVWMHRSFGQGSVSDEAVRFCRDAGIDVIPGGCPMMFREGADFGHKCMRFVLKLTGRLF
jgi:predicted CoA-binding protein